MTVSLREIAMKNFLQSLVEAAFYILSFFTITFSLFAISDGFILQAVCSYLQE